VKRILITGGGSGIGLGIAKYFASQGMHPIVIDVNNDLQKDFHLALEEHDVKGTFIVSDTSNWESASEIFANLTELDLLPNILINNVSPRSAKNFLSEDYDSWIGTNKGTIDSSFNYSRCFIKANLESYAPRVINISSVNAELVGSQSPSYHVAKAGLEMLTKYLAVEGKKLLPSLTVNAIQAGMIVQDRHRGKFYNSENSKYREVVQNYAVGGIGQEKDFCKLIEFLISIDSSFINGAIIKLDGGASNQEQLSLLFRAES
jgi:3-oxoacyl-[acyl-carrier protein] reductase